MKVVVPERMRGHLAAIPHDIEVAWYSGVEECLASVAGAEVMWVDLAAKSIPTVLEAGADLRWVSTDQTGMDRWPLDLVARRRLTLTNGVGLQSIPIAESVVMGLLAGIKRFPDLVRAQDRREWLREAPSFSELRGRRALIYGYGSIGRAVAERLRPFGVAVTGVRAGPTHEPGVITAREWQAYLPQSDLLILAAPLTPKTRHLIGPSQLASLPQGAWLANVARGGLIDENAMIDALKSGHLGGAYLDVTTIEPLPAESELWSLPNVILSPHVSWASDRIDPAAAELFLLNLEAYRHGEPLRNVVDLGSGY